ncbi:hypothetical protein M0R04_14475 [Candidatus Dojkabacteria bacterium]|jgi:hypothetical protein|nr:hypothetical protein [Candidatus Dojkabacteria bacterium]
MTDLNDKYIKEFRREFPKDRYVGLAKLGETSLYGEIQDWLSKTLKQIREEALGEAEEAHTKYHNLGEEECGGLGFCGGEFILSELRKVENK